MRTQALAPIGGGLNESTAPTDQPAGTYVRGVNVRGIGPRSGRQVWGAQRAGLTAFGEGVEGAYVRHFATSSKLRSAREWVDLATTPDELTEPTAVGATWQKSIGERPLAVATGPDGSAYVLGVSGDVVICNPVSGDEVDRIPSATPRGFATVGRVFVDEVGAVYTAATRSELFEGGAGRVYRWVRDEQGVWSQAWESVILGPILTFTYRLGTLYVAEGAIEDEEVLPALSRIGAPLAGPEVLWRETRVAAPIVDVTVTRRGQAITSSPAAPERATGDAAAFTARAVDWTPPELPAWPVNAWAWIDGLAVNDPGEVVEDGDPVRLVRDRRFEPTEFDPIDENSPERVLRSFDSSLWDPPQWDAAAFGGVGGIRFDTNSVLVSGPATDASDATTHATIIPSAFDSYQVTFLVQFDPAQADASLTRIWSQIQDDGTAAPEWYFLANALGVYLSDIESDVLPASPSTVGTAALTAIISIVHRNPAGASQLYVNGTLVGTVTLGDLEQGGPFALTGTDVDRPGVVTVFGAGRPNRINMLRDTDVVIQRILSNGSLIAAPTASRLFDGLTNANQGRFEIAGGSYLTGSGALLDVGIRIDFGSSMAFDSFSFWSASNAKSAATVRVTASDEDDFSSGNVVVTVDVTRGTGDGSSQRDDFIFPRGSGSFRYVKIEPLTYHGAIEQWQVSEIAFYRQDTRAADFSAKFVLGELVAIKNAQASERQFIEGYIAHRWGLAHTLDAAHPYFGAGNVPTGTGSSGDDAAAISAVFSSPYPVLAKYGTDGTPLAAYTGAGVGLGAAVFEDRVFAIGDTQPGPEAAVANYGTLLTRFDDTPRSLVRTAGFASSVRPADRRAPLAVGPCSSVIAGVRPRSGSPSIRRFNGEAMTEQWSVVTEEVSDLSLAGLQLDLRTQGQACGPEFVFAALTSVLNPVRRFGVLGLRETGLRAGRDVERLAVFSNGDVRRSSGAGWEVVEAGALSGETVGSATLFGLTFLVDGRAYRVYDNANRTMRDPAGATKGVMPPRCELVAGYRSRLVLARGDNAFTLYFSAFGQPLNFDTGTEVETVSQAVAGTIAAQGRVPEPITALMPFRDDFLFIGTTESLFVLSGDLADGGRLDQVDRSQGVAYGYAWCESPSGIYYFSARGGVVRVVPGGGLEMVSSGAIQRRLEDINLETNRVRMAYNWIDKTVHVYVIPFAIGSETQHFVYEEPLRAWHVDDFGQGLGGAVTAADSLIGDAPDDRTLLLGFGDGRVAVWDQYAEDDAGREIQSSVLVGPLVGGRDNVELRLSGVYAELASDGGPIEVAARASNVADLPGPAYGWKRLEPGRGFGVGMNVSAPAVFVEVRGVGRPWEAHGVRVEASPQGSARRVR